MKLEIAYSFITDRFLFLLNFLYSDRFVSDLVSLADVISGLVAR
jgi:hypothetical protein